MSKRSTNFNGGVNGSARDRRNRNKHFIGLMDWLGIDETEQRRIVEEMSQELTQKTEKSTSLRKIDAHPTE